MTEKNRFVTLVTFCTLTALVTSQTCPPTEDVAPCTCKVSRKGTVLVECVNINSEEILTRAVQALKGYEIAYFKLVKSNLSSLPSGLFDGTKINRIEILSSVLNDLGPKDSDASPFIGLEDSLTELVIFSPMKSVKKWNWKHLSPLTKMKRLLINRCHNTLKVETELSYVTNSSVTWFQFSTCCITEVRPGALDAYQNLETLDLMGNRLSRLRRATLPKTAPNLKKLELSRNMISIIDVDTFTNLPALKEIYLESNDIAYIYEDVFGGIWNQLELLDLKDNNIICDINLAWIVGQQMIYDSADQVPLQCGYPSTMTGRSIKTLTKEELRAVGVVQRPVGRNKKDNFCIDTE
ncbi:oplophorus-luciferin 2-monooxygenase non-catalytic subunit-like [Limulus polyphemus]|uniref:Oplophorus-luciferin 2-monooxygenase non-catalytic subunit-like n=1 Tax=Limulus polyphemus TaxID=6850 RepID=A0ABM1BQJ0_LIMPO|nr:oplophorus-luciferin 2-monooxygenase non-catalytic subunit-like [Limulus polyphemus]